MPLEFGHQSGYHIRCRMIWGLVSSLCILIVRNFVMSAPIAPHKALNFFSVVGKLKTTLRTGWVDHKVPQPESVADHMYRMTMLC